MSGTGSGRPRRCRRFRWLFSEPSGAMSNKGRHGRPRRVEFEMLARLLVPHTGAQSVPPRTSARTPVVAAALAAAVLAAGTGSAAPLTSVTASGAAAGAAAGSHSVRVVVGALAADQAAVARAVK